MTTYLFLIIVLTVLAVAVAVITFTSFTLSNEQYDRLKAVAVKWSGIVTLLGVLVSTFNFAYGEETITVVAALGAFLAYVLGISDKSYYGGSNSESEGDENDDRG